MVPCAPRDAINEDLLDSGVQVSIGHHEAHPVSVQNRDVDLAHTMLR